MGRHVPVEDFDDSKREEAWLKAVVNPVAPHSSGTHQVVVAPYKVGWEALMRFVVDRTWASLLGAYLGRALELHKMAQETYNRLEVGNQEAA